MLLSVNDNTDMYFGNIFIHNAADNFIDNNIALIRKVNQILVTHLANFV